MYANYEEAIQRYPLLETYYKERTMVSSELLYYSENELNSRLAGHFTVPFSAAYPTVKDLTIDLAWYRAIRTRDPKEAGKLYKTVLDRIEDLKSGKEAIWTGSDYITPDVSEMGGVWSSNANYRPTFNMLDAKDQSVDPNRIDDEESIQ